MHATNTLPRSVTPLYAASLASFALGLLCMRPLKRGRLSTRWIFSAILLATISCALAACGGSSSNNNQTPPGTYTVTVTGTVGSASHSTTTTLVVN
jgi:hypothetical protein